MLDTATLRKTESKKRQLYDHSKRAALLYYGKIANRYHVYMRWNEVVNRLARIMGQKIRVL